MASVERGSPYGWGVRLALLLLSLIAFKANAQDWEYVVQPGDSVWSVSETYLLDLRNWRQLQRLNRIADPYHIPPGRVLRIPMAWLRPLTTKVTVASLQGVVQVLEAATGQTKPATVGAQLSVADEIRTGPDANAHLQFPDGSTLLLQADSRMRLADLTQFDGTNLFRTLLRLLNGRTEIKILPPGKTTNRFAIDTPAALIGVRGTEFRVGADAGVAQTEVLRNEVSVARGAARVPVSAGYGTVARRDQSLSAAVPLLPMPDLSAFPRVFERVPMRMKVPVLEGARSFRIQIARDSSFSSLLYDRIVSGADVRGPDLPDGDYVIRMRGISAEGLEGRNATLGFTLNARPDPPFLVTPEAGAGVIDERPALQWSESSQALSYRLQIAADGDFANAVVDVAGLKQPGVVLDKPLPLGKYAWRVAVEEGPGIRGPFSDPQPFRRTVPPPKVEEPAVSEEAIAFRWPAAEAAQKYQFQLAKDAQFKEMIVDETVTQPELKMKRPAAGKYYMHIRVIEADGFVSPYGASQSIEVPGNHYWWWLLSLTPLFILL